MAKCMGIGPVSFKSGIVGKDKSPQDKFKDACRERRIARQEMRRKELEDKAKNGETLTTAEKAELAEIYLETVAEKWAEFDPRIYENCGTKLNCVA